MVLDVRVANGDRTVLARALAACIAPLAPVGYGVSACDRWRSPVPSGCHEHCPARTSPFGGGGGGSAGLSSAQATAGFADGRAIRRRSRHWDTWEVPGRWRCVPRALGCAHRTLCLLGGIAWPRCQDGDRQDTEVRGATAVSRSRVS